MAVDDCSDGMSIEVVTLASSGPIYIAQLMSSALAELVNAMRVSPAQAIRSVREAIALPRLMCR